MSENGPHGLICLNVWSPLGDSWVGGLSGVALEEKVYCWGWALRFQKSMPSPVSLSASYLGIKVRFQLSYRALIPLPWTLTLWNSTTRLNTSFYKLPWPWCLTTAVERQLRHHEAGRVWGLKRNWVTAPQTSSSGSLPLAKLYPPQIAPSVRDQVSNFRGGILFPNHSMCTESKVICFRNVCLVFVIIQSGLHCG